MTLSHRPNTCIYLRCPGPLARTRPCLTQSVTSLCAHTNGLNLQKGFRVLLLHCCWLKKSFLSLPDHPAGQVSSFSLSGLLDNSNHYTPMVSTTTCTKDSLHIFSPDLPDPFCKPVLVLSIWIFCKQLKWNALDFGISSNCNTFIISVSHSTLSVYHFLSTCFPQAILVLPYF